jgi:hypothetical protein
MTRSRFRWPEFEHIAGSFVVVVCAALVSQHLWPAFGDLDYYLARANDILAGEMPFRDFTTDYPPLSLIPQLLPRLWPDVDRQGYGWGLVFENAVFATAIAIMLVGLAVWARGGTRPTRVLATWTLVLVPLAPIVAWRYDLSAVVLAVAGVLVAVRGRSASAGILLGLGAMTKVFPAFLVPVLAVWFWWNGDRRGAVRFVGGAIASVAVVMGVSYAMGGQGALLFLNFQLARGLQLESLGGSFVLLDHLLTGLPTTVQLSTTYQSFEVVSPLSAQIATVLTPAMVVLLLVLLGLVMLRFRADRQTTGSVRRESLVLAVFATITLLLLADKVFSPQYLVWLLPFGALLPRRAAIPLAVASFLTLLVYPIGYPDLIHLRTPLIVLLLLRNLLLLALLLWSFVALRPRRGDLPSREQAADSPASLLPISEREPTPIGLESQGAE